MKLSSGRNVIVLCVVLLVCVSYEIALAVTGTSAYTDCYGTGKCGSLVSDAGDDEAHGDYCSGKGTCPTAYWTFMGDPDYDRCSYSYPSPTPGTPGSWTYYNNNVNQGNNCGNSVSTMQVSVGGSTCANEEATSSYGWSIGSGLKGGLNVAMAGSVGIEVTSEFSGGSSETSSKSVCYTDSCTITVPACGHIDTYRSTFRRTEPSATDVTFQMEVQCVSGGQVCYGWHVWPWNSGTCTMDADLTSASKDSAVKCTACEVTCGTGELHQNCCGSGTTTGPCNYDTW